MHDPIDKWTPAERFAKQLNPLLNLFKNYLASKPEPCFKDKSQWQHSKACIDNKICTSPYETQHVPQSASAPKSQDFSGFLIISPFVEKHHRDWNMGRQREKQGGEGRKKRSWRKGEEMRTPSVSNFETTANKSQSAALLKGDAWIISRCQVKWLPVPPPLQKTLHPHASSFSLSPYLVMSHCIFQYILPQTCGGAGGERGGCLDKWAFRADVERMGMKINLI